MSTTAEAECCVTSEHYSMRQRPNHHCTSSKARQRGRYYTPEKSPSNWRICRES